MNEGVRVSVIDCFGRKVSVSSDAAGESSGGDWSIVLAGTRLLTAMQQAEDFSSMRASFRLPYNSRNTLLNLEFILANSFFPTSPRLTKEKKN